MSQSKRKLVQVSITLTKDQLAYMDEQVRGARDRSRWIRRAIDMRIVRESADLRSFMKHNRAVLLEDETLQVGQDREHEIGDEGDFDSTGDSAASDPGTPVEG